MDEGYQWLKSVADKMNKDVAKGAAPEPERLTVRQLLHQFGYQKRGEWINNHIRNGMEKFKLRTDQDFTIAWLGSRIAIEPDADASGASGMPHAPDPTHRVGQLEAANRKPKSVKPESLLSEATTMMQMNDYSRLPVMKDDRDVSGIVTWKSIGARTALGLEGKYVKDCMEPAQVIPSDTRLFDAIREVSEHGYVLVRARDKTIAGIVTATDLLRLFLELAEPFLFIGEIEGHLRNLIHGTFTLDQLQKAAGGKKPIEGAANLMFGGYQHLLGDKDNWKQLGLGIDRGEFIQNLDSVRKTRNEIMHFNPDGIDDDQRRTIRSVARFLDQLARLTPAQRPRGGNDDNP